jgi:hypothetical protein
LARTQIVPHSGSQTVNERGGRSSGLRLKSGRVVIWQDGRGTVGDKYGRAVWKGGGGDDPPVQSPPQYHRCPIASSNSAPLFLGEFTCLLTGQTFSTSAPAGRNSVAASTSTSPNHADQSWGSRITGIRS